jgi:cell wall-associated NlpC family hydrolase
MSTPDDNERAAALLERLLADPQLRAEFRRRPVTTCRAFDLPELAAELESAAPGAITLEQRESRSSLAGVMISAAVEGLGLVELVARHADAIEEGAQVSVRKLVERVEDATAHDRVASPRHDAAARAAVVAPGAAPAPPQDPADLPGGLPAADPAAGPAAGDPAPTTDSVAGAAPPADPVAGGAPATDPVAGGAPAQTADPVPASTPPATHAVGAAPQQAPDADHAPDTSSRAGEPHAGTTATASDGHANTNAAAAARPEDAAPHRALVEPGGAYDATAYPGDETPQVQLASWMAERAAAADLPGPLPVMAALERSGLTNLPAEGHDAAGFFGMSRATWSVGPYAGFAERPDLQLTWFLDRAAVVRAEHVAAGDAEFGRDPGSWHEWVTAALGDRAADSERGRGVLGTARELLDSAAHASDPHVRGSDAELAGDALTSDGGAPAASPAGRAVALAKGYLGDPYRWGGAAPSTGFDCSGLVQYVYGKVGIALPRVTDQQFAVGQPIARDGLRVGDIVFFRDATGYIHHEGLYVGGGEFLHAPHTGDVIKVSSLSEPYYASQFAGGRRVAELAAQIEPAVDVTRRAGGALGEPRVHDARVMPTIDPSSPRPSS